MRENTQFNARPLSLALLHLTRCSPVQSHHFPANGRISLLSTFLMGVCHIFFHSSEGALPQCGVLGSITGATIKWDWRKENELSIIVGEHVNQCRHYMQRQKPVPQKIKSRTTVRSRISLQLIQAQKDTRLWKAKQFSQGREVEGKLGTRSPAERQVREFHFTVLHCHNPAPGGSRRIASPESEASLNCLGETQALSKQKQQTKSQN